MWSQSLPNDDALRAKIGLPTSYSPDEKMLARYYDKENGGKPLSAKDVFQIYRLNNFEFGIGKYLRFLKGVIVGGIFGAFLEMLKHQRSNDFQLFPNRKLERYIGDYKRMSFTVPRYLSP